MRQGTRLSRRKSLRLLVMLKSHETTKYTPRILGMIREKLPCNFGAELWLESFTTD